MRKLPFPASERTVCRVLAVAVLVLALAAPKAVPVAIYVGPLERDGYKDADSGVLDSIEDVKKRLRKKRSLTVVDVDSPGVPLKLYVVTRGIGGQAGSPVTITIPGTVQVWPGTGNVTQSPSTTFSISAKARHLAALLRVGTYERPFVAEDNDYDTWGRCADLLAKDVSAWVAANGARVAKDRR